MVNLPIVTSKYNCILKLEDSIKCCRCGRIHKNENGFECNKCKERDIMTKTTIISFSKILIINFKRIGEEYFYNHNVEIPPELDIDKYKYDIIFFIKHIGIAKSGHNIPL